MIWNLDIAKDYGRLLDDIRNLSIKSRLLLEKGAAYQFDLSLIKLALSSAGMETEIKKKKDKLNHFPYEENVDPFIWKYKFYNIKDNQIKDCKMFDCIRNLKTKVLSLEILKQKKNIVLS